MIDLESVNRNADCIALARRYTNLKPKPGEIEWFGPCPLCGGNDRFNVRKEWALCRKCIGKKVSAIGFVALMHNLDRHNFEDLKRICEIITGGNVPESTTTRQIAAAPSIPAYTHPNQDWQNTARTIIQKCTEDLWNSPDGQKALKYLKGRGLQENTIRNFNLGYSAGFREGKIWVPKGITIPCEISGQIWYLKIRLPKNDKHQKYTLIPGSKPVVIFNAGDLRGSEIAIFCEGEFDCMIAAQEVGKVIPAVTFGSATNRPDLARWGLYLLPLRVILAAYDADDAGEAGMNSLVELAGDRVKLASLPDGIKDINDLYLSGTNTVWEWIKPYLQFYDPLPSYTIGGNQINQIMQGGISA